MAVYDIEITATVRKTIRVVECDSEQEAVETAHQLFTVRNEEGVPEQYDEQPTKITKVSDDD